MVSDPIFVVIKTFNRPLPVMRLLRDVRRELPDGVPSKVLVFDDGSDPNYGYEAIEAFIKDQGPGWDYHRFKMNHGKVFAWKMVTAIYGRLKSEGAADGFTFFLDDDMRLCRDFFRRATELWGKIQEPKKATLHLMVDSSRKGKPCWTGYAPKAIDGNVVRTQWVDGSFMCNREYFAALNWHIQPIPRSRWGPGSTASTGVGSQVSKRLNHGGYGMFQVVRSLVVHTRVESRYNPISRRIHPLDTVDFIDDDDSAQSLADDVEESKPAPRVPKPKTGPVSPKRPEREPVAQPGPSYSGPKLKRPSKKAKRKERPAPTPMSEILAGGTNEIVEASLASIPSRVDTLRQVVESLLPQVDLLRVFLNGYDEVPSFLKAPEIVVARSQDHGDGGDAGKFHWCEDARGYQLICDDDLAYPHDYTVRMVEAIERHDRQAVVGLHGVILREPMLSYYKDRHTQHFRSRVVKPGAVHLLGTGCMAYHASAVEVRRADFELPNMADIWMGLLCQKQHVPMVLVVREEEWVTPLETQGGTIYDTHRNSDAPQTEAVMRIWPWRTFPPSKS